MERLHRKIVGQPTTALGQSRRLERAPGTSALPSTPDIFRRRSEPPRISSRGFLPWRFSDAGPGNRWRRRHGAGTRKPSQYRTSPHCVGLKPANFSSEGIRPPRRKTYRYGGDLDAVCRAGRAPATRGPTATANPIQEALATWPTAKRNILAQSGVSSAAENYPPSIHYPGTVFGTTRPPPPARRYFFRTILNCYVRQPMCGIGLPSRELGAGCANC